MTIFAVEYVYAPDSAPTRDQHRPEHRAWLNGLVDTGEVLASGPFQDGAGALLIFKAENEESLNQLLTQDPFNTVGVIAGLKTTAWNPIIGALRSHAS
jgi:uncharacterized protein